MAPATRQEESSGPATVATTKAWAAAGVQIRWRRRAEALDSTEMVTRIFVAAGQANSRGAVMELKIQRLTEASTTGVTLQERQWSEEWSPDPSSVAQMVDHWTEGRKAEAFQGGRGTGPLNGVLMDDLSNEDLTTDRTMDRTPEGRTVGLCSAHYLTEVTTKGRRTAGHS
jgi:hypothetical protein